MVRLEAKRKHDELIGRIEARFKLLGDPIPFGLTNKSDDELRLLLDKLRAAAVDRTPPPATHDAASS